VAHGPPAILHVVPKDACGLPLGAGHEVVVESSYGTIGAAVFDGRESWDAPFTVGTESCEAAPASLRAVVDGVRLDDEVLIVTRCPLTIAEGAPVILETANLVASVGVPYRFDADRRLGAVSDTPVSWSLLEGPDGLSVDRGTGFVGWVPTTAGEANISVGATNDVGTTVYTFVVDVLNEPPGSPVAAFEVTPSQTRAGLIVEGDASASAPAPGGQLLGFTWDFGDGSPLLSGIRVEHRYLLPGNYVVRVEVVDAFGMADQAARDVLISNEAGELPPRVHILSSTSAADGGAMVALSCDCEAGSSPLAGYLWDFGDGESTDTAQASRLFLPGRHEVRLVVVGEDGLASADEVVITIDDDGSRPPLLTASASPSSGMAPLAVQLEATAQDLNGENIALLWDFGDGGSSTERAPAYVFTTPGYYRVSVTATDGTGLTSTSVLEVSVTDDGGLLPPQFLSTPGVSAEVGVPYRYDDDGKPAVRGGRPLTFELGKMVGSTRVGAPAGMSVDPYSGELLWIPTAQQAGPHGVTLVAWNAAGIRTQEFEVVVAAATTGSPGPEQGDSDQPSLAAPLAEDTAVPVASSGCATAGSRPVTELALLALLLAVPGRRRRQAGALD
ncbi:MAG: PKD domain-containing protein, partial [Myxococcota bacterium]